MSLHLRLGDEAARLDRLDDYGIFGSPPEPEYDALAEIGALVFGAASCLIVISGAHEHWLKARWNFPQITLSRTGAFCCYALASGPPFVCLNATSDPRFAAHPLVLGDPRIRFYAGAALTSSDGTRLGVVCIIDSKPRETFTQTEVDRLAKLAGLVSATLERRRTTRRDETVSAFSEASALASVTSDAAGRITSWNRAAEEMFARRRDEVVGRSIEIIMPERFRREHGAGMRRMTESGVSRLAGKSVEIIGLSGDGREFPIEMSLASWTGPAGREYGAHIQDISERKARQQRLEHMARYDPLTGLANRPALSERLNKMLEGPGRATLIRVDFDGFKTLNNMFGRAFGDALLQTAALRMRACVDAGVLGRLADDDFLLLLEGDDPLAAHEAASKLIEALDPPFLIGEHKVRLPAAIGVALAPAHGSEPHELLMRAEVAMLRAKTSGPEPLRFFDAGMANQLEARRAFMDELLRATREREWRLYYQPQVSIADGSITGFEALLRWCHPQRGVVAPAVFIAALETHPAAYEVGCWVLDRACGQLAAWRKAGLKAPRVGVNLFAAQLHSGSLETEVLAALERHGLTPGDLELEITETIALTFDRKHRDALMRLRRAGVGIALDDFGTGFASLATLKDFPVTRLKIDRSFVNDLCESAMSRAIVEAVVSIGRALDLDVIAEGVETTEQCETLYDLGCPSGQGYLYAKPYPSWSAARLSQIEARASSPAPPPAGRTATWS